MEMVGTIGFSMISMEALSVATQNGTPVVFVKGSVSLKNTGVLVVSKVGFARKHAPTCGTTLLVRSASAVIVLFPGARAATGRAAWTKCVLVTWSILRALAAP